MRILTWRLRFEERYESLDSLDIIKGWTGCFAIYKLYRYFVRKHTSFVELVTVRINTSLF